MKYLIGLLLAAGFANAANLSAPTFSHGIKIGNGTSAIPDYLVRLNAVEGMSASYTFTFPASEGTSGQALVNSGSGATTWGAVGIAGGGTNSGTALNNNRVMKSSGDAIVEAAAITASRALISDANGIPTHSSVTSTELGYVSGVTSAIQTQLDAKVAKSTLTTKGDIYVATGSATVARQAVGSNDTLLVADSAQTNGIKWGQADLTASVTGVLPIANGGTNNGSLSVSAGAAYYADGSKLVALAPGSSGQLYTSGGTGAPTWTTSASIAQGGTNNGSLAVTNGGVIYSDGSKLMNTGAGSSGQILKSTGAGAPAWLTTLPIANGGTNVATLGTSGGVLYYDGSGVANTGLSAGGGTTAYALTHAGTGQVPSWSTALVYGTFSPTLTNGTNTQASTTHAGTYIRVGSVVDFCFTPDWDPTSTGLTLLGISIPFSSTLGASTDATGVCTWAGGTTDGKCICYADPTNHRVECSMIAVTTSNASTRICIQYVIN